MTIYQVLAIAFVCVAALHELRLAERRRLDKYADIQPPEAE